MGGCRCSYKNCTNTTKSSEVIHFFHYPVRHRERCVQWIENARKPMFYDLEEEQLRNKVVCEMHFESRWFQNSQKKRLLQGAVPTLDGDCNNDVKVVPANEDGTVFVLDSDNMFTLAPKIESYIIKNGVLEPTHYSPNVLKGRGMKSSYPNRFTKPSTSTSEYVVEAESEIANINTPPGPSKQLIKQEIFQRPPFKKEVPGFSQASQNKQLTNNEQFFAFDNGEASQKILESEVQRSKPIRQGLNPPINTHGPSKSTVSKNYLRQIKQHSRDIASIKRMLKQKRFIQPPKPDLKTVLNELQQKIPPSLFTILSLIVGERTELNEEDIEFFTSLHRGSPEVYQMLSEKYKWNLPSVDVVDSAPE